MVATRIPGTDRIIFLPKNSGDHVINYQDVPEADVAVSQEDVVVYGDWQDYYSSGTKAPQQVVTAGQENQLQWDLQTLPDNQRLGNLTVRGNLASTTRQRTRLITIESKKENTI